MSQSEPKSPNCLGRDSLGYAPTTGMRHAPELLVLELFRELAYGDSRHPTEHRPQGLWDAVTTDDTSSLSEQERLLLNTCRGTRRGRPGKVQYFFTPPYPGLSRHAWFRKQTDRTVRDYFLRGPLAHQALRTDPNKRLGSFEQTFIVKALLGQHSARSGQGSKDKELLSLIALDERSDPPPSDMERHLRTALHTAPSFTLLHNDSDPFSERISRDFLSLCALEATTPRREWLFFLIGYLRIATAMWMLAHLRATILIRKWVLAASQGQRLPTTPLMREAFSNRYIGLLHPASFPTTEVFRHVEHYMKARVELRLLLGHLETSQHGDLFRTPAGRPRQLSLESRSSNRISLPQVLELTRAFDWNTITDGLPLCRWLTRQAERWSAWRSPLTHGQGKNINEFLRVLRDYGEGDAGSHLLGKQVQGKIPILPGHRLLQLFAFLATQRKTPSSVHSAKPSPQWSSYARNRGKLVLRDLEHHLSEYGIDFVTTSYGRNLLLEELVQAGLLNGSPDAGESAEILDTLSRRSSSR